MTEMSHSVNDTEKIAKKFLKHLVAKSDRACIIGLSGDLGSGKTTFSQSLAKLLGITESVTSPTFVIEKIYTLKSGFEFKKLIHIDAYRLESGKELEKLGWHEIINDKNNLILIEWPEKIADILPSNTQIIQFKFIDETTREITF